MRPSAPEMNLFSKFGHILQKKVQIKSAKLAKTTFQS